LGDSLAACFRHRSAAETRRAENPAVYYRPRNSTVFIQTTLSDAEADAEMIKQEMRQLGEREARTLHGEWKVMSLKLIILWKFQSLK